MLSHHPNYTHGMSNVNLGHIFRGGLHSEGYLG